MNAKILLKPTDSLSVKRTKRLPFLLGVSMAITASGFFSQGLEANPFKHRGEVASTSIHVGLIKVTGKVTDEKGEALPGVSILLKGTQTGTLTDGEGKYALDVPDNEAILMFSYVGYVSKELTVRNQSVIDIQLVSDSKVLDEMVVIGYGTAKKSDLTGSVARVNASTFKNQSVTQITDVLAGTIAGFQANQGNSAAGGSSMEIRGVNSLNASTSPMIILDGVIFNGDLKDINSTDIETMDILKDASSTAIYGARAANGVILITTNKGQSGKPTINFSTKFGISEALNTKFGARDKQGYLDFRRDFFRTLGLTQPDYYWFSPDQLPQGVTLDQWRAAANNPNADNSREWISRLNFFPTEVDAYMAGESIDWVKEVFQKAKRQEYDISVGGGTDNVSYYWSIGYLDNEGIILGDNYSALRSRLNVDFKITKWLNAGVNAQYSNRDESAVAANLNGMYTTSPYSKMYNSDGSLAWFPHGYVGGANPLLNTYGQDRSRVINSVFASMYASVALPFGITYRLSYQPRIEYARDFNYWSPQTLVGGDTRSGGYATREDFSRSEWMIDNLLKWNKKIGIHNFDVTLLYNAENFKSWREITTNEAFAPSSGLGYHGMQFGGKPSIVTDDIRYSGDGMMARINYSLLDKYLFTASVRRDGFSAFGQENPRAVFPAAAFAWKISNEGFFKFEKINELKLRLSWGKNGNRDIGPYAAFSQMNSVQYYDGANTQIGIYTSSLSNPGLKWEETASSNIGIDLGLFGNRVTMTIDAYDATTRNLLVRRSLPRVTGFEFVTTNIGALGNRGFEFTLGSTNVRNPNITWRSNVNFSLNRNRIKTLFGQMGDYVLEGQTQYGEVPDVTNGWFIGKPIDVVWNYDIQGVWQVEEAEQAKRYNLKPGDLKAVDVNDNGTLEALQDKRFIGFKNPRYNLGFRNDIDFLKNFTASIFIRADLGHIRSFIQSVQGWSTFDRTNSANYPYWTADNRSNDYPRLNNNVAPFGGGVMPHKSASFVRIQDVSLSYNIPATLISAAKLKSARVFGSVRNLATFTKWPGWDPETGMNPANFSLDPMPRTFTIGVNVSL
ncbi:SusC/RagA family TonB-linked outer membrane protein [Dyadobacter sp. 32]|uniref:SusC/RagA family TonB-linked outer membrane protein n=1 Tax=Dyadobacter sp. 32 TaxID=538966 RepID=UPI0039C67D70